MRTLAIGDIHGSARALETLLALVSPRPDDVVVTLGDYIRPAAKVKNGGEGRAGYP